MYSSSLMKTKGNYPYDLVSILLDDGSKEMKVEAVSFIAKRFANLQVISNLFLF